MNGLLVIAEHRGGEIREETLATLAKAQAVKETCQGELSTILLGHRVQNLADQLRRYAQNVFYVDDERLELYHNEMYGIQISDVVNRLKPRLVMMGQSAQSLDLMPALSAKLGLPLITDCRDLTVQADRTVASRQMYEGRVTAEVSTCSSQTSLETVKPDRKVPEESRPGNLFKLDLKTESSQRLKPLKLVEPVADSVDISKADIVVGVGLGFASMENIQLADRLADALGGVVGCTRPITDKHRLPQSRQIGFSGKTIKAKLYVAVGLSGSTHHVKGVEKAQTVIAVNKDAGAPIFNYAHYGVVGDLFDTIPAVVERLDRAKMKE